ILQMSRFGLKIKNEIGVSRTIKTTLKMNETELKEHIKKLKKQIFVFFLSTSSEEVIWIMIDSKPSEKGQLLIKDKIDFSNTEGVVQFKIVFWGPGESGKTTNFLRLREKFNSVKLTGKIPSFFHLILPLKIKNIHL
ncbi:MAG: hypothetical protein ACTSPS_11040, partial [Promethearchaeota archaeon]